ncbi:MAG: LPP20 family lipoprotein [Spirochaetales bacterium]|nr:LPP20 family lipoprotein [Spirochaetales bacterium]
MMRRNLCIFAAVLLLAGLLVSCASSKWVSDPYASYPQADYVCAVGKGSTQDEADLAARRELAALFGMSVQSTISRTLVETSVERDGRSSESFSEFFTSNATTTVNVDNLYGVEIAKRTTEKDGRSVSLAVMEKKATADYYLARLKSDKEEIDGLKASIAPNFGKLKAISDSVSIIRKVNDYNTSVVMCNYLTGGEIPFMSLAEFSELYRQAMDAVVVDVVVEGDPSGAVKSAVDKIVTGCGLSVAAGNSEPTAKVAVTVVWRESAGTGVASSFLFADYNADISLVDLADGESIFVRSYKGKEGHQTFESAKARAITDLVGQIEDEFGPAMREVFTY